MIRHLFFAVMFALSYASATAADSTKYITSGRMHLETFLRQGNGIETATWSGNIKIRGRVTLDIDLDPHRPEETRNSESFLCFIPDTGSLRVLPRVLGEVYPDKPIVITLANERLFDLKLGKFMSKTELEKILSAKFAHYEWTGTLTLKDLETGIGGDGRQFNSRRYRLSIGDKPDKILADAVMGC